MGRVRARLRTLYAGGRELVWIAETNHVRGDRDCHRCIRLRVWGAGKNSQKLLVDLLSKSVLPWGCATDCVYPTPKDVRRVVDYALTHGWDPSLVGGTYFLSEREHAEFELEDFLLTDRLRDCRAPDPDERVLRAFHEREAAETES